MKRRKTMIYLQLRRYIFQIYFKLNDKNKKNQKKNNRMCECQKKEVNEFRFRTFEYHYYLFSACIFLCVYVLTYFFLPVVIEICFPIIQNIYHFQKF